MIVYGEAMPQYTERELLELLQAFGDDLGKTPTYAEVNEASEMPSANTYLRRFDSWNAALREAGFKPNAAPNHYLSDETLRKKLRAFAADQDHAPTSTEVENADTMPSSITYINRFGSWADALREIGVEPVHEPRETYTDEELLSLLRELTSELGHPPRSADIADVDWMPTKSTYHVRFGSWSNAVREAGFEPYTSPTYEFSDEELLDMLREFADEQADVGGVPSSHHVDEADYMPSSSAYAGRFGDSWADALIAADLLEPATPKSE